MAKIIENFTQRQKADYSETQYQGKTYLYRE